MKARAPLPVLLAAACLFASALAHAADPADAGAGTGTGVEKAWAPCIPHVPAGATPPQLVEVFPARGLSGYAAALEITVTHGKGETVLPEGIRVSSGSDAAKALGQSGFVIPEPDGGSGPTIVTTPSDTGAHTKVVLPFVALPKDPGRNVMVLPPVPITIARASGDLITVCTAPHVIVVDDPIASELDPKVKPNAPPRSQREEWVAAEILALGVAVGLVVGGVFAWLLRRWMRRPKFVPPPPPRIPWFVALEELENIRRSTLLEEGHTGVYFDRVSDCVRSYLGARYGFDGLESTTDEMRALLRRIRPQVPELKKIGAFLADCDLVKFAGLVPDENDCLDALRRGEEIVRMTIPAAPRPTPEAARPATPEVSA